MMNAKLVIKDNGFLRQFECNIEGVLAKIEYAQQDRKIFLTKLVMDETLREKGHLEPFIESVLEIIKETNQRVVPTNPDIAKYIRKNRRKYKDLLPVGMTI